MVESISIPLAYSESSSGVLSVFLLHIVLSQLGTCTGKEIL